MSRLYAIHKDGELYITPHSKNAYRRERDAKKVVTEAVWDEAWDILMKTYPESKSVMDIPEEAFDCVEAEVRTRYEVVPYEPR